MYNGMKYIRKNNANILVRQGFMLLESVMTIVIVSCIMSLLLMQHGHALVATRRAQQSLNLFWASQAFLAGESVPEGVIVESSPLAPITLPDELVRAGITRPLAMPTALCITFRYAHSDSPSVSCIDLRSI